MEREGKNRYGRILKKLDFPQDTMGDLPRITMVGDAELLVEQHGGILQCTEGCVRLMTKCGVLRVEGAGLILSEFGFDRAVVRGVVRGWRYEEQE